MHQKQPPAKIATAFPGGAAFVCAAKASASAARRYRMGRLSVSRKVSRMSRTTRTGLTDSIVPQPCRAAHAAGIAVDRGNEARPHLLGNDVRAPQLRHILVQAADLRESAAQHDDAGVEEIHDRSERAREARLVAFERRGARGIAGGA